jgi:flagellar biosynthesis chaperone FliJ
MKTDEMKNHDTFDPNEAKAEINRLLKVYRVKKDDLEWADDEWEISEVQEELDGYARRIKVLKSQMRKYEQSVEV